MEKVAEKLSVFLASKNIIEKQNIDFYRYSLECLLLYAVNLFTVFGISLLLGRFLECIFFVLVFSSLRTYSGGVHMKKWYSCYIASCAIILGIICIVDSLKLENYFLLIAIISSITIWKLAPFEN